MKTGASFGAQPDLEEADRTKALPLDRLHPQSGLRGRVLQNAATSIAGRGLAIVFSAGAAVLLARYLGAEKLGQYGAIYAYLGLFSWSAAFGFEPVLVREISREKENASHLMHTAVVLSAFFSIGAVVAAVLLGPLAGYAGRFRSLLILAGLEYALTPLRLPAVMFQVEMRQWYAAAINMARQGLWFGIIVVLWISGAPLSYVIAGRVLAAVVESGLLWSYGRRFLAREKRFLLEHSRMIVSHSFPIAFTSLLAMIYLRIDQVMLHRMVSDAALGQYVAAVKVSELFEFLPSALMSTIAPILSVSVADPERFKSYIDRAFRYFTIFAAGLCVFMSTGAGFIVHVLYGNRFSPAGPLLAVLIWSEIPVFFASVVINVLIARNQQNLLPVPTLVGAVVNVALNLILIPRYGALGASWATLVSYTLAWMACLLLFKQTRSVTWQGLRYAMPTVALALAAAGVTALVFAQATARISVAMGIFLIGLWLTRSIRSSDMNYVAHTLKESIGRCQSS